MSKLDSLIQKFCPKGVEYKKIGEICNIMRGKRLTTKELLQNGKYPVIHGGTTPMGFYGQANRKAGTTIVINTGNAGCVFFIDKEFWSSDACFSIYPCAEVLDRYLFHFLSMKEFILKGKIRAGAMPTIDSNAVESIEIPVPPLPVQREIVQILDKFTELTAELTARKKQYEYYRDRLLSFERAE